MAYYSLSQVIKMRRKALGHSRYAYDAEGPSAMAVYRTEEKGIYVSEKNYRKLTRAMGEEESTRRGVLCTKDIRVLWLVNDLTESFYNKDYETAEALIGKLEEQLDCSVKRNQQYLTFIKAKLQYKNGLLEPKAYEKAMREGFSYGTMGFEKMMERKWPFLEREWNRLLGITEAVRRKGNYEEQKKLLSQMQDILEMPYMESEYKVAYRACVKYRLGERLGNLEFHREAIEQAEETLKLCEEGLEWRYLPELYYDIFWNYQEIKKNETLTMQEEMRCKECLMKAYYLSKALYPEKKLYEQKICLYYPEVLI